QRSNSRYREAPFARPAPRSLSQPTGAYCCSREPQARRPSEAAVTRNDGLSRLRADWSGLAKVGVAYV
ncbi:hypothetical protein FWG76_03090, partial [Candidatus Saccharibacteria bacterium]|nr:hypothetical protein [Candidatus Saccharibacteria bacterium]